MLHKLSFKIKVTMNLYRNQKKVMLTKKPKKKQQQQQQQNKNKETTKQTKISTKKINK